MSEHLPSGATPAGYERTREGTLRWLPPSAETLGRMLPNYEVERLIGCGGMGAVYKGMQRSLDRPVAIKVLPPEIVVEDATYVDRFKNEARVMARLSHPNIAAVYDFGETDGGQLYLVMEHVNGTDLQQRQLEQGCLPQDRALAIAANVCDALHCAHTHGVIHRDIKPSNILINSEGSVKVVDFGVARLDDVPNTGSLAQSGLVLGTPDYAAPETLMQGVEVDGRVDLYALGVMLYVMLTDSLPQSPLMMPSVLVPGIDPRVDAIIAKAMQYDREERYQSALAFRRDIEVILLPKVTLAASRRSAVVAPDVEEKPQASPAVTLPATNAAVAKPQTAQVRQPARRESAVSYYSIAICVVAALGLLLLLGVGRESRSAHGEQAAATTESEGEVTLVVPTPSAVAKAAALAAEEQRRKLEPSRANAIKVGHSEYLLVKVESSWPEARQKAESMGGHLATITSSEENEGVIRTVITPLAQDGQSFWLGASQTSAGASWQWQTGEPFPFMAEGKFEPETAQAVSPASYPRYLCLQQNSGHWIWEASGSPSLKGFVVEWDLAPLAQAQRSQALPASWLSKFPAGQWMKVLARPEDLKGKWARYVNGWIEFNEGSLARLDVFGAALTNGGVRLTCRNRVGSNGNCRLLVRADAGKEVGYALAPLASYKYQLACLDGASKPLSAAAAPTSEFADAEVYTLELIAIGPWVAARVNGELLAVVNDSRLLDGWVFVQSGAPVRDIEVINLDGLPEAEALKLIGLDEMGRDLRTLNAERWKNGIAHSKLSNGQTIPELAGLQTELLKQQIDRVKMPFLADVVRLNAAYLSSLLRAIAEERKAGQLKAVKTLEAEIKLITKIDIALAAVPKDAVNCGLDACPLPADADRLPASLQRLRDIYRAAFAKIELVRDTNLKALTDAFNRRLQQMETDLAQQQRLADARTVKAYRERLGQGN